MSARFVELHARSAFSFLRGASLPEEMMQRAAGLNMTHLAITDRDGVYGSARAHYQAREIGGPCAIVGAELTMEDESVLPVLVKTRDGYENLCMMLTRAICHDGRSMRPR
jgi:error-prone DNA polymerase